MELTCIRRPLRCPLQVELAGSGVAAVSGNQCVRDARYAEEEAVSPSRVVTGLACVPGTMEPLSVKTDGPVPRDMVTEVAYAMRELPVSLPVRVGDALSDGICGLDAVLIATEDLGQKK